MGPHSFECGILQKLRHPPTGERSLQWGRTHSSAEYSLRAGRPARLGGFNGAALIRVRNTPLAPCNFQRSRYCFNGAALIRVRNRFASNSRIFKEQSPALRAIPSGLAPQSRPSAERSKRSTIIIAFSASSAPGANPVTAPLAAAISGSRNLDTCLPHPRLPGPADAPASPTRGGS